MTGDELKDIRREIGDAIGRRLSIADMARICGIERIDTYRNWEEGDGPSGPVATLLSIISAAYRDNCDPAVPEFFDRWIDQRLVS
jgi:DNA-binding transcriptional regulator YiaG